MPSPFEQLISDLETSAANPPPSAQRTASTAGVRARSNAPSRIIGTRRPHPNSTRSQNEAAANDSPGVATSTTPNHAPAPAPSPASSTKVISSSDVDSPTTRAGRTAPPPDPHPEPNLKPFPSSSSSSIGALPASVAAQATRTFFDPWNSSSTGHQRAENRLSGSTSWRESRNLKLSEQYRGGLNGGKRVGDTVGAGSEGFGKDGRKANGGWERGASGLRLSGQRSLAEVWGKSKGSTSIATSLKSNDPKVLRGEEDPAQDHKQEQLDTAEQRHQQHEDAMSDGDTPDPETATAPQKQIFEGLCFYLNGSTMPLVSDHKLKHLLAERGGKMSIALGRRRVTHVILGTANSHGGCGGGLAASKIQKEIARVGGKGVKFISVDWVLESVKAQRRLPESRFSTLKLAPQNQNSVYTMFQGRATQGFANG